MLNGENERDKSVINVWITRLGRQDEEANREKRKKKIEREGEGQIDRERERGN